MRHRKLQEKVALIQPLAATLLGKNFLTAISPRQNVNYFYTILLKTFRFIGRVYNDAHDEKFSNRIVPSVHRCFAKIALLPEKMSCQAWLSVERVVDFFNSSFEISYYCRKSISKENEHISPGYPGKFQNEIGTVIWSCAYLE